MNPSIVQLRGTVFMPVSIGYNEENKNKFMNLLPTGQLQPIQSVNEETIIRSGMRLGEPWQIIDKGRSIAFNYSRVDIIENRTNEHIAKEAEFVNFCIDTFSKILKEVGCFTRIAYSPTFAMDENEDFSCRGWWKTVFINESHNDYNVRDISLTYLLTKNIQLGGKELVFNIHNRIFDGYKYNENQVKVNDSIIITLDMNTAEESNVILKDDVLVPFFNEALNDKKTLMNRYFDV